MAADIAHHAVNALPLKIAVIGTLGIGAQWLAWRLQRPAIVLMAIAGLIFGPLVGYLMGFNLPTPVFDFLDQVRLDPVNDFGDLYRPMIGLAVAIILFEGGMTLRFKDLEDSRQAVGRMVFVAAPIAWALGATACHYIVGLAWDISVMVGGLFVVTGPTVIMPLLRQAHLKSRPANVLKWEGIVNDPLGALFAVGGYEFIRFSLTEASMFFVFGKLIFAAAFGTAVGIVSGIGMAWAFRRGHIPEYLKAPVVLAWVLLIYVLANKLADETGLLAVTALGMTMANTKFASMVEMRRFKENIAIILVSGVFVILTATLTPDILKAMMPKITGLGDAIKGDFSQVATLFVPLAFALVFATVLFAGFLIGPISKLLGLAAGGGHGVMIVGANPWSLGLAKAIKDMGVKVTVADTNWRRLRGARLEGHATFFGEVLSENADYSLDHSAFDHLVAATPNDAYNSLVCVEFAPELGRHRVFQVPAQDGDEDDSDSIAFTSRGRTLTSRGRSFDALTRDWWGGWRFRSTNLSESYTLDDLYKDRGHDLDLILAVRPDGSLDFIQPGQEARAEGTAVLSFCPATDTDISRGEGAKKSGGLSGPANPLPA